MRNITVDNVKWRYKVGKAFLVAQQPDTKQKLLIQLSRLLGYEPNDYERDAWKGSYYVRVTPKLVADFIKHSEWYQTAELGDIMKHREDKLMPTWKPDRTDWYCLDCHDFHPSH